MKKCLQTLLLSSVAFLPFTSGVSLANDIEVIELESIADPSNAEIVETPVSSTADMAKARLDAERLVSDAYFALKDFEHSKEFGDSFKKRLNSSLAILIFPDNLKASWFFGVNGGKGILFARSENGEWSYPSFYTLAEGSYGLQMGVESSRLIMTVTTGKGLAAVIDNRFTLGASANGAAGKEGGSIGYDTTTNLSNDIQSFALSKGAAIGISVGAGSLEPDALLNEAFYGTADATTQSVVLDGQYANKSADAIREYLSKNKPQYD